MPKNRVLHVFNDQKKFSKDFFYFLMDADVDLKQHTLFQYGKDDESYMVFNMSYFFSGFFSIPKHIKLLKLMLSHEKIILHCFASPWIFLYLYMMPKLNKKTYWVIWGKDLYFYNLLDKKHFYHNIYEYFRKKVFKNVGHLITYIKGDYDLAKEWYGVKGQYHECLMYPSNLFKDYKIKSHVHTTIHIQVGNSSDPSNNHIKVFKKLERYKSEDIKITVPLSYGSRGYAKKIRKQGIKMFGEKLCPITEFMPFNKYLDLLAKTDIAIFNHNRQQAMGNIITLLGLGKKVYIRNDITPWNLFKGLEITVYDVCELTVDLIGEDIKQKNQKKVKEYFSSETLAFQWRKILEVTD